jgi:alkanesulfonate monooxygenase SsuD/methylene tetrahydromethanopterin reductase-like flavin-dependent oxidoreductase (luciferase family)
VKFSVALPTSYEGLGYPIGLTRDPAIFIRLAQAAERFGYDGVWGNDHLVTPAFLGEQKPAFHDPLIVLSHVAAATKRIHLGTAVLNLPLREPILLARQAATLSVLSNGRLILGVGLGAYPEELAEVRPDAARRGRAALFDKAIAALRARLDAERPVPIYVGGHTTKAIERAARWGQGWIPGWRPIAELREWIAHLWERASASGRDPRSIEVAPELSATIAQTHHEAVRRYESSRLFTHRRSRDRSGRPPGLMTESNLVGDRDTIKGKIAALEAAGVDHCAAIAFPAESEQELLEQWERFAQEVIR